MRMCTVSTGGRQLGSNPAPPSTRLVPAGVDLLFFFSCLDRRERPARRLKAPAVIRSIGVVATPLPSKQVSPVRVRYAAPHGLYLGVVESPSFKLAAGKDLPAGLTSSGGYTVQRERPRTLVLSISGQGSSTLSGATNDCRSRGIYLDSRQRPARRSSAPAVIRNNGERFPPSQEWRKCRFDSGLFRQRDAYALFVSLRITSESTSIHS